MHGDSALPLMGEIQCHTQILVGVAPVDFHLPQTILKYTLVLGSEPSNSIIKNCRGFMRDLAFINVETDHCLLSLDHLIGHAPIVRVDLVPLLHETLHKPFFCTIMLPPWFHRQHSDTALAVPSGQPCWLTHMGHKHLELCSPECLPTAL
jgi:hypothetical protein